MGEPFVHFDDMVGPVETPDGAEEREIFQYVDESCAEGKTEQQFHCSPISGAIIGPAEGKYRCLDWPNVSRLGPDFLLLPPLFSWHRCVGGYETLQLFEAGSEARHRLTTRVPIALRDKGSPYLLPTQILNSHSKSVIR